MTRFDVPRSHIHSIARGLLVQGEEIILCRIKGTDYFSLPGGHIEDGESAKTALLRELKEETGFSNYEATSFVGVCENVFSQEEGVSQHEINIVIKVNVPLELKIESQENHLEFVSILRKDFKDYRILPVTLKAGLIEWFENEKPFFKEIVGVDL
ncbi:MAG: NUDIX domain-containing protein [Patescibacteria group bacterium]